MNAIARLLGTMLLLLTLAGIARADVTVDVDLGHGGRWIAENEWPSKNVSNRSLS